MKLIVEYLEAEKTKITEDTDEKNGEKQLYQDLVEILDQYKKVLEFDKELISNIKSAL